MFAIVILLTSMIVSFVLFELTVSGWWRRPDPPSDRGPDPRPVDADDFDSRLRVPSGALGASSRE
jgi:hypothetical protein